MISLPLINSLDVKEYGLYPGNDREGPGLHIRFAPGLTLVLGANGLGKTTLVTMLYRLLTGPYEIPALLRDADLGTARLQTSPLRRSLQLSFASRVAGNASDAWARLEFQVGDKEVLVERNLRDLTLRSFTVGESDPSTDENLYQKEMARLSNVSTFGDWILLLRYIVFYFEDRRSLVWDPSAQRQLLRILFLEPNQAQTWTVREREILEAETQIRNTRAVVTSARRRLTADQSLSLGEPDVRDELDRLEEMQFRDNESFSNVNSLFPDIETRHEKARLHFLQLEQNRESAYRELEEAQLLAVNARLPTHSDSVRYILSQLFADATCLACGNRDPKLAESIRTRVQASECVVCGSGIVVDDDELPIDFTSERISLLADNLSSVDNELEDARIELEESEYERKQIGTKMQALQADISERKSRIESLLRRLPPEESEIREQREELSALLASVEVLQQDLEEKRESFEEIIVAANSAVAAQASEVKRHFEDYADDFLLEACKLVWSPRPSRLGQAGRRFDFPAFDLELGGSDFSATLRRGGPEDVSESQREFIDISFRMALAKVAAQDQVTSLIMDAPESSLDMVFVDRAASVLGRFGRREEGNRLIVTSNLIAGDLIPKLLTRASDDGDRAERVVDLLTVAAPTAALRTLRDEYFDARDELLSLAGAL